jgi:hypothetical protein
MERIKAKTKKNRIPSTPIDIKKFKNRRQEIKVQLKDTVAENWHIQEANSFTKSAKPTNYALR